MLAFNVLHRGPDGITRPLDFNQGAPAGFFEIEKAATVVAGTSELALRAVPLIAGIVALVLARALARRHLDPPTGLTALALLSTSPALIYFSGETKQYSLDVALTLAIFLAASWTIREPTSAAGPRRPTSRSRWIVLAITGAVALVCSHAALFTAAAVGLLLAGRSLRPGHRDERLPVAAIGVTWLVTEAVVFLAFTRQLNESRFLEDFWSETFLPLPPIDAAGRHRWSESFAFFVDMLTGHRELALVVLALAVGGAVSLGRRTPAVAAALLLPWALVVVASSLHRYPGAERLVLFLVPTVAVLTAAGATGLGRWIGRSVPILVLAPPVLLVLIAAPTALLRAVQPVPVEELGPLLAQVAAEQQPGDAAYSSAVATPATDYYVDRLDLRFDPLILGQAPVGDPAAIDAEIRPLDGRPRVWVITAAFWQDGPAITPAVPEAFDRLGTRLSTRYAPGAAVYLYDLTGPHPGA
jgi:hypothetical protein